ncbi:hypothetical protein M8818_004146 [Zalaria obscura]|uniref:Uncharacterized protein n=1 Tax=Zalaria obscura TaxID=2024903 RepID=A0ACC3SD58_9PEZI
MPSSTTAASIVVLLTLGTEASPVSIALRGTNSSVSTGITSSSSAIESAFASLGPDLVCGMLDLDNSNTTCIESGADRF